MFLSKYFRVIGLFAKTSESLKVVFFKQIKEGKGKNIVKRETGSGKRTRGTGKWTNSLGKKIWNLAKFGEFFTVLRLQIMGERGNFVLKQKYLFWVK